LRVLNMVKKKGEKKEKKKRKRISNARKGERQNAKGENGGVNFFSQGGNPQ